ncbi:LytS/YhcK type 5TM receptor domain-containing protein [Dinoroseobacter sp. PD6]|uniref:LytS/YhcK type 5TM receptor domain-containing protein n=1 Tax=Dinoroseobacter sp. PD6 TaxID=3028384 RepID=UPI00237A825A|nr:LytS/YhcK type 5TM receptor domain-containing protein [Dinoroseobacter sp. PD6]MDD9716901.1 LytS/YhcK type 5TM receptor domain-containing protein [Dinoroseobacter sp. PD6]
MIYTLTNLIDLAASLGLIFVLGFAYSRVKRMMRHPRGSEAFLGAIFGLSAITQMLRPFEPMEGLLIDLRNIPIALAGAFLGWRGAAACLAVTVATRLYVGGVGMWAGALGMVLALAAGIYWARKTKGAERRGILALLSLALLMSAHLVAALILPEAARTLFLADAALPIFLVNMIAMPIAASILERERRLVLVEDRLRASVHHDPDNGLATPEVFQRDCAVQACARDDGGFTAALALRLRSPSGLAPWRSARTRKQLLAAIHLRLKSEWPEAELACGYGDSTLLVALPRDALLAPEETLAMARRIVTDAPYDQGHMRARISADVQMLTLPHSDSLRPILDRLSFANASGAVRTPAAPSAQTRGAADPDPAALRTANHGSLDRIFAKAEMLMTTRQPRHHSQRRTDTGSDAA